MRIVIIIAFLLTAACAKKTSDSPSPAPCESFDYPYMVEYLDGSIVKSSVSQCGSELTAKALDQSGKTLTSDSLTVQLNDVQSGIHYLTSFTGQ